MTPDGLRLLERFRLLVAVVVSRLDVSGLAAKKEKVQEVCKLG